MITPQHCFQDTNKKVNVSNKLTFKNWERKREKILLKIKKSLIKEYKLMRFFGLYLVIFGYI